MKLRVAALAICLTAAAAHADSKAWTTARSKLPAGMTVVVGINVAPIKSSQLYQQFLPLAMAKAGKAKDNLDQIKTTCGIDLTGSVDSVVIGMLDDDHGVAIVQLKGTTQKALEACGAKVAKAEGKTLTITKDGAVTKYGGMGEDDAYVRWFSKDSLAVSSDKDTLTKLTAGGIAKDTVGSQISRIGTDAALWVVVKKDQDLGDFNAKMSAAYGTLDVKGGNLAAKVHLVVDSAENATKVVTDGQQQLDAIKKSGQLPKQYAPILDSVKLEAKGSEVVMSGSAPEADLLALAGQFLGSH
jgi:hypothetical protein